LSVLTERVKALLLPTRVYAKSALRGFERAQSTLVHEVSTLSLHYMGTAPRSVEGVEGVTELAERVLVGGKPLPTRAGTGEREFDFER
jgi:hypothetical protein